MATTDNRPLLRELAHKHGVLWIDGTDLQRLKGSDALSGLNRLTEEEFSREVAAVDDARNGSIFKNKVGEVKSAVIDRFGPSCANTALEGFHLFSHAAVNAHPGSPAARVAARLSYLAGSIAAASFDFASAEAALRPTSERIRRMTDAIRFGADADGALSNLKWTEAAIREYVPNGAGLAQLVRDKFMAELNAVPAEGLAEIVIKLSNSEVLFRIAKALERAAYATNLPSFDGLDVEARGFLGALLDFTNTNRAIFAKAWPLRPGAVADWEPEDNPEQPETPEDAEDKQSRLL